VTLPEGWAPTTIGEVSQPVAKWDPRSQPESRFTYIDIGGIDQHRIAETKAYVGSEAPSRARQLVRAGDTVLSTVRTYLKKTALVPTDLDGATASTGFCVIRPSAAIDSRFLFYRVTADDFVSSLSTYQTGSSYPAVRDRDVFAQRLALPPLAEQRRIVATIEEQFSRLDSAGDSLRSATSRAGALRASLLEQATAHDATARVREVAVLSDGPFGSNLKTSHYVGSGPRVVRLQNIGGGAFRDEKAHITDEHFSRLSKHAVEPGDVVAASLGDDVPRACLIPDWLGQAIVKADCIRLRPTDQIDGSFLMWLLNSRPVKRQAAERIKGVGRPRLGLRGLGELRIPVPPLDEQRRIVAELEQQLSLIDSLRAAVESAQKQSAALRRAILERAFRGELVPQDPADEPASVLLERIRAERAATPSPRRRRRAAV
jgi:type I restriction enzyme, S subunit